MTDEDLKGEQQMRCSICKGVIREWEEYDFLNGVPEHISCADEQRTSNGLSDEEKDFNDSRGI